MRILLVTDWNRGQGGAEAYIARLRDALRAEGDCVELLTASAGSAGDGMAEHVVFGTEHVAAQSILQIGNPFAVYGLKKAIDSFKPDVVFLNMFLHHLSPAILAVLKRIATVLFVTDYKSVCPVGSKLLPDGSICMSAMGRVCQTSRCLNGLHWLRDQVRYAVLRKYFTNIDGIIACSQWVQNILQDNGIESTVALIPDELPAHDFKRIPAAVPTFLFLGRLDVEKGLDVLILAFSRVLGQIPQAKLRIVGRGPLNYELEEQVASLNMSSSVEFCGWQSREKVEEQLVDPWALVVPSTWAEPLGMVAIEAVTRGVPVIVSESGGLAEIIKPGISGFYFPNGDVDALSKHMLAIARKSVFEGHVLDDKVVAQARSDFSLEKHIRLIRGIMRDRIKAVQAV